MTPSYMTWPFGMVTVPSLSDVGVRLDLNFSGLHTGEIIILVDIDNEYSNDVCVALT